MFVIVNDNIPTYVIMKLFLEVELLKINYRKTYRKH